MRNGTVDVLQQLTTDNAQAAKSLRLPLGEPGLSASPYQSVVDLIKHWPGGSRDWVRREVLMISDGIDRLGGGGPADSYVYSAIEQIQRAGVVIYAIYANAVGHYGHTFWRLNWGQNYLSQVTDETGGEAYFMGLETPSPFHPISMLWLTGSIINTCSDSLPGRDPRPDYRRLTSEARCLTSTWWRRTGSGSPPAESDN